MFFLKNLNVISHNRMDGAKLESESIKPVCKHAIDMGMWLLCLQKKRNKTEYQKSSKYTKNIMKQVESRWWWVTLNVTPNALYLYPLFFSLFSVCVCVYTHTYIYNITPFYFYILITLPITITYTAKGISRRDLWVTAFFQALSKSRIQMRNARNN